jgi:hypothetical protein
MDETAPTSEGSLHALQVLSREQIDKSMSLFNDSMDFARKAVVADQSWSKGSIYALRAQGLSCFSSRNTNRKGELNDQAGPYGKGYPLTP